MPTYKNTFTGNIVKSDTAPGEGMGYVPYTEGQDLTDFGTFESRKQGIGQVYQSPNKANPFMSSFSGGIVSNQDVTNMKDITTAIPQASQIDQWKKTYQGDTNFMTASPYSNMSRDEARNLFGTDWSGLDLNPDGSVSIKPEQLQWRRDNGLQVPKSPASQTTNIFGEAPTAPNFQDEFAKGLGALGYDTANLETRQASAQLAQVQNKIMSLQQQYGNYIQDMEGKGGFENIVAGRQARLNNELNRLLQPLAQQEQMLISTVKNSQDRAKQIKDDVLQQIALGQENYKLAMQTYEGRKGDYKWMVEQKQKELDRVLDNAKNGTARDIEILKALDEMPEGFTFELSDGSTVTSVGKKEGTNIQTYVQEALDPATGKNKLIGLSYNKDTGEWKTEDLGDAPIKETTADNTGLFNDLGQELNSKQQTIFNQIINKYSASPLIAARDRLVPLIAISNELKKDPKNASNQAAFIYSYIQALDTYQSAVREGEIGFVQGTQGLRDRIANIYDQINQGTLLNPNKVKELTGSAQVLVDSINNAAQAKTKQYESQARVNGLQNAWQDFVNGFSITSDPNIVNDNTSNKLELVGNAIQNGKVGYYVRLPDGTSDFMPKEEYDKLGFKNDLSMSQNGSQTLKKVATVQDNTKAGQCGRFVNKYTNLGLGDSYQSKLAKMDKNITEPQPGMVFLMPYKDTGHVGFILDVQGDKALVKDSNYGLDEKVKTHWIPISKMSAFKNIG